MWRTGAPVDDPRVKKALQLEPDDEVVGFLYIGTPFDGGDKPPHHPDLNGIVHHWSAP